MYIHVYECKVMYVHCTYTFMIVNMCMYIVQTRLRLYSSTTTLHFSSGPISLATQASLSSVQAPFLQSCLLPSLSSASCWNNWLNPVCTMYIHCIYTFIRCIYMHIPLYMGTTDYLRIPLPCMPVCTAHVRCMYYAIVH